MNGFEGVALAIAATFGAEREPASPGRRPDGSRVTLAEKAASFERYEQTRAVHMLGSAPTEEDREQLLVMAEMSSIPAGRVCRYW